MDRIWSSVGCFFLTLLAILFAVGVTESIKYSSMPIKFVVLGAAVLGAGAIAYLRDQIKFRRRPGERSALKDERPAQPVKVDQLVQPSHSQRSQVDLSGPLPPGSGPAIQETILAARRQAILFRQIVPPNHNPAHLSFFGGLPIAPSDFQWPSGEKRPFTFIMQVDCSAVPVAGRLGIFPDQGAVYLFLDLEWGEGNPFRMIYEPGPSAGWSEIASPPDLPHAFDSKLAWRWPQSDNEWPRLLPKWPFDPVLIQGGPLPE